MKFIKKYWYAVAVFIIPVTATAIYFGIKWYNRRRFVQPDTTDEISPTDLAPMQDTEIAPLDLRGTSGLSYGLLNNNPGNIRATADAWKGKVGENGGFVVFESLPWGIRAAAKNVAALITVYGTLKAYINAYAPPSDGNDTSAYLQYMVNRTGIQPSDKPSLDHDTIKKLITAHFEMEVGANEANEYITDDQIEVGLALTPFKA